MIFAMEDRIGKYKIIGQLGRGGMGEVFLAEDSNLHREVALKVLQGSLSSDENFIEQFRKEARSISRIVHPNIVQIHNMEEVDSHLLIDMEYVEGQPYSNLIKAGPVPSHLAASIALDVLHGLSVCHQAGVVHRDIKPSNILLTTSGQGKIVDFGIAKALADSTASALEETRSTTIFMGTPRYTPPEAWDGGTADARWDLYALGIMTYESLTGEPAFASKTMYSLMREVISDPLPPIESKVTGLSEEFSAFINDLIEPDPDKRTQSAKMALERLKSVDEVAAHERLDTPTITIPRMKPLSLPKESVRKGNAWLGIAIATVVLTSLLFSLFSDTVFPTPDSTAPKSGNADISALQAIPIAGIESASSTVWWAEKLGSNTDEGWTILWNQADTTTPTRMLGFNNRAFIYLDLTGNGSQLNAKGEWAEYRTAGGFGFQSGDVTGAAIAHDGKAGYTLTLSRVSNHDRSRQEETFYVGKHPDVDSRTEFVRTLEGSPWLPSLLYNEIQPRRLPIGIHFDALFPTLPDQRADVPWVSSEMIPSYDGSLYEPIWKEAFFGRSGRSGELHAIKNSELPPLLIRHNGETLFIGINIPSDTASQWTVKLAVQQTVAKAISDSLRGVLILNNSGREDLRHFEQNREIPFPDTWRVESSNDDGSLAIEIGIPIAESVNIDEGTHIRMVCIFQRTDEHGSAQPDIVWGATLIEDIEHGALLNLAGRQNQ